MQKGKNPKSLAQVWIKTSAMIKALKLELQKCGRLKIYKLKSSTPFYIYS
jgi:hypothetical protein